MAFYLSTEMNVPSLQSKYLTRDASNFMLRQLQGVAGTSSFPSYCFRGDNRTGMYWFSQGIVGLSSLGWTMFTFTNKTLTFYDRFRNKLNLTFDTLTNTEVTLMLPTGQDNETICTQNVAEAYVTSVKSLIKTNEEVTETIKTGMVVKLSGDDGVELALADDELNFGIGLASNEALPSELCKVDFLGLITMVDWTDVTATTLLTVNQKYYLSDVDPGMVVSTPPTNQQLVGVAVSPNSLLIKL
jgi:hypothetical protein